MKNLLPFAFALLLTGFGPHFADTAVAESKMLTLSVAAGEQDRLQTPVKLMVTLPMALADVSTVRFEGVDFVGQLTKPGLLAATPVEEIAEGAVRRELHFVIPQLAAGESMTFKAVISDEGGKEPSTAPEFHWRDTPGKFSDLSLGDRPVLRYMYEALDESTPARRMETYKPYHQVYDPEGKRFVTKGPGGLFPHHRGLFYGFNKISYNGRQADTWHCNNGESESHEALLSEETGPVLGRHRVAIDWHGRDGAVFAKEQREMTVYNTPGGLLIQFASRLETTVGEVKLDGDPQHAGFQFRASQDVPDKTAKQTYYVRPDGKGEPGRFRNWPTNKDFINLPWNALCFVLDGMRYTCCYLDRPENPKEARFSERDYGRFGSYFEYTLNTDRPLDVSYRIWLQEGEMEVDQVNRLSGDFVRPPAVSVKEEGSPASP